MCVVCGFAPRLCLIVHGWCNYWITYAYFTMGSIQWCMFRYYSIHDPEYIFWLKRVLSLCILLNKKISLQVLKTIWPSVPTEHHLRQQNLSSSSFVRQGVFLFAITYKSKVKSSHVFLQNHSIWLLIKLFLLTNFLIFCEQLFDFLFMDCSPAKG